MSPTDQSDQAAEPGQPMPDQSPLSDHVIIAGFGIAGRCVADLLEFQGIPYCVVEANDSTTRRVEGSGTCIICGDACDAAVLQQAGIERATTLVLTIPSDDLVLRAIETARQLRPDLRILARCSYTSSGLKANTLGAAEVIVAEQVVAREFFRAMEKTLGMAPPTRATMAEGAGG